MVPSHILGPNIGLWLLPPRVDAVAVLGYSLFHIQTGLLVLSYEEHVLKHYAKPYHRGENPCGCTHHGTHQGDACGDEIHVELHISAWDIISQFYWTGEGCCFSQAAASMLAEYFERRGLKEVEAFTKEEMLKMFAAEVPSARIDCVLTAFHALKHLETTDAE